ncbi:MAG: hypothetical protein WCG94_06895, partial [Methanothrix sp.]
MSLGEDYLKAKKLADTIMHEAEELAAGRSLPHKNQSEQEVRDALKAVKKDSRAKDDVCFTADELTATFAGGRELFQQAVSGRLESLGLRAGGCAIDKSFGLPANSMYTWYTLGQSQFPVMADHLSDEQLQTLLRQLTIPEESGDSADQNIDSFESETEEIVFYDLPIGTATPQNPELFETITNPDGSKQLRSRVPAWNKHEYNINNFKLAVGIADLYQKSKTSPHYEGLVSDLNNFRLPELDSVDKINHVASSGFRIIQNTVIAKLLEMMPGFGRLMGRYRLTTQDFVKMMNGDMTPLIGKVGGYFLDNALEMPRGTGNALIYPPCLDLNGVSVKCDKLHGAESDPDNVRTRILAEVGLKKLGLYVPEIPANFNFFSPGNLLENWGNASISEALGLAPNSFKGLFSYDCYAATNTAQSNANNPLRCQNSQEALLKAFKLDTLPFVSSILRLQNSLLTQARSKLLGQYSTSQVGLEGARETAYQWYSTQINQLVRTYFEDLIFKKLQDPASDYWK